MKSLIFTDSNGGPKLLERESLCPKAGPGELLIRIYAAGVTPTELAWYPTTHDRNGGKRSDAVPGHEFSGAVAAIGEGVSGYELGREVFGLNDWFSDGALAEYCVTTPSAVAPKPSILSHAEAASVPIGALTAWQGLFERVMLKAGERVLVQGGAGAVGVFAIQLARDRGAHVIATASAGNLDFVGGLGAHEVIDYRATPFENQVRDVDIVFDAVGGETLERSWGVLRPGGRMVTVAAGGENARDDRTKRAFFIVEPNKGQLTEIGDLLQARRIRAVVDSVVPFSLARAAYSGALKRLGRGKVVVAVADSEEQSAKAQASQ